MSESNAAGGSIGVKSGYSQSGTGGNTYLEAGSSEDNKGESASVMAGNPSRSAMVEICWYLLDNLNTDLVGC